MPTDQAVHSLLVPELWNVWSRMEGYDTLDLISRDISRGIEWNVPYALNKDDLVSQRPKSNFAKGLIGNIGDFTIFESPKTSYLNIAKSLWRTNAFERPWDQPKVILNANRKSRGRWRIACFADEEGLVCYQTFTAIWAKPEWNPKVVAAILNGIVANCFISAHESARHITIETLRRIPVPHLADINAERVIRLVDEYAAELSRWPMAGSSMTRTAADILNELDGLVLDSYRLTREHEESLRAFLRFEDRPVSPASEVGAWWLRSSVEYEIILAPSAEASIRSLEPQTRTELLSAIDRLRSGPDSVGAKLVETSDRGSGLYLFRATPRQVIAFTVRPGRKIWVGDVISRAVIEQFS
jgi:hypothetical protein